MIFLEEQTHAIELSNHELGRLGEGKLTFGAGKPVSVRLSSPSPLSNGDSGYPLGVVRATADNGRSYTLYGCTAYEFTIYADYAIVGDVPEAQFHSVDIRYSDISEWFLQWRRIVGKVGEKLTWSGLPKQISVDFDDGDRRFNLTTEYNGHVEHKGEDHILHEHIGFSLRPADGLLNADDAKKKAMELACLLSILVAQPVSILDVSVQTAAGRHYSLYFPTFKPVASDASTKDFVREGFAQKPELDGKWETILQSYFQSAHRKVRWTRLAGMQRYEGFWEYKTLGYVSLLDSYVSHYSPKKSAMPPRSETMGALRTELDQFSPPLDQMVIAGVLDAVNRTFCFRRKVSFPEKYDLAIAASDPDIVKIINISAQNFQLIKKVRDRIAHGDDLGLEKSEFQQIHILIGRIELLLTYWAFVDLGFSKDDFLQFLDNPLCRLHWLPQIDAKHLARVTKSAEFLQVSAETFRDLSSRKGIAVYACFEQEPNREIEFSDRFSQMQKDWHQARHAGAFTADQIFGVSPETVRHVPQLYIEYEDRSLEFHSAYIFDTSKLNEA